MASKKDNLEKRLNKEEIKFDIIRICQNGNKEVVKDQLLDKVIKFLNKDDQDTAEMYLDKLCFLIKLTTKNVKKVTQKDEDEEDEYDEDVFCMIFHIFLV